jgi:hypothetical protein
MSDRSNRAERKHTGRVYDVDFLDRQEWVQVLMDPSPGSALRTRDARLQTLLLVALQRSLEVTIRYQPSEGGEPGLITQACVDDQGGEAGMVKRLAYDSQESRCQAVIVGEGSADESVSTWDYRAQAILEAAMIRSHRVEGLDSENGVIRRVKINTAGS